MSAAAGRGRGRAASHCAAFPDSEWRTFILMHMCIGVAIVARLCLPHRYKEVFSVFFFFF